MTRNRLVTLNDRLLNIMNLLLLMHVNNITHPLNIDPRWFSHTTFQSRHSEYSDCTKPEPSDTLTRVTICGMRTERIPASYCLESICMSQVIQRRNP
jgi:hypothetical protein